MEQPYVGVGGCIPVDFHISPDVQNKQQVGFYEDEVFRTQFKAEKAEIFFPPAHFDLEAERPREFSGKAEWQEENYADSPQTILRNENDACHKKAHRAHQQTQYQVPEVSTEICLRRRLLLEVHELIAQLEAVVVPCLFRNGDSAIRRRAGGFTHLILRVRVVNEPALDYPNLPDIATIAKLDFLMLNQEMNLADKPTRINKYLAHRGLSSRREADALIASGQVRINGRVAKLGDQVRQNDKVEVGRGFEARAQARRYFLYHKPVGVVAALQDDQNPTITEKLSLPDGMYPVGRLDKDSHGLLILTNDGRVVERLLSPNAEHTKEYLVTVNKVLRPFFLRHLEEGVNIEGYQTKPAVVERISDNKFSIKLTEGKRHQIRRMCAAFGYTVIDLARNRILGLQLSRLKPGEAREFTAKERELFLNSLGLK